MNWQSIWHHADTLSGKGEITTVGISFVSFWGLEQFGCDGNRINRTLGFFFLWWGWFSFVGTHSSISLHIK